MDYHLKEFLIGWGTFQSNPIWSDRYILVYTLSGQFYADFGMSDFSINYNQTTFAIERINNGIRIILSQSSPEEDPNLAGPHNGNMKKKKMIKKRRRMKRNEKSNNKKTRIKLMEKFARNFKPIGLRQLMAGCPAACIYVCVPEPFLPPAAHGKQFSILPPTENSKSTFNLTIKYHKRHRFDRPFEAHTLRKTCNKEYDWDSVVNKNHKEMNAKYQALLCMRAIFFKGEKKVSSAGNKSKMSLSKLC